MAPGGGRLNGLESDPSKGIAAEHPQTEVVDNRYLEHQFKPQTPPPPPYDPSQDLGPAQKVPP